MKKMYLKKEEGVSPVIATILMVAITVVLAATVWLLVSGYMGGTSQPNLTATLTYDVQNSNPNANPGYIYLKVSMSTPSTADWTKVVIGINGTTAHLTGQTGSTVNGCTVDIEDLDGNGKLSSGDVIKITAPAGTPHLLIGATISIAIDGYSGSQTVTVP